MQKGDSVRSMDKSALLQDKAFYELRRRIQNGTYPPGTKLVVQEISDSLEMSRTPIVAAINRLIAQGIVEATHNRGTVVARITPSRVMEAADIRLMIETFCAKYVVKNIRFFPDIVAEMRKIIEQLKTVDNIDTAYELDNQFHTLYVRLANNQSLLQIYESNWSVGCGYWLWANMKNGFELLRPSFEENEKILDLSFAGDAKQLEDFITHHLQIVYDTINWHIRSGVSLQGE